jgi:hypothetical protein
MDDFLGIILSIVEGFLCGFFIPIAILDLKMDKLLLFLEIFGIN